MHAAGEKARQCEARRGRAAKGPSSQADPRAKACIDRANAQVTTLRERIRGHRELSRGEQSALRDEETRIVEARMKCLREAR